MRVSLGNRGWRFGRFGELVDFQIDTYVGDGFDRGGEVSDFASDSLEHFGGAVQAGLFEKLPEKLSFG